MNDSGPAASELRGSEMSFLDHLDELRKRLVNSIGFIVLAFAVCWFLSGYIYDFLSIPIRRAISEASRRVLPVRGLTGKEAIIPIDQLKEGDSGRYTFDRPTKLGVAVVIVGTSVQAKVARDADGQLGLFTSEALITPNAIIPAGVRLPVEFGETAKSQPDSDDRMTVTTPGAQFTLYVTVSLYAAIALSVPFLLWQIWLFVSPALYMHERAYVTPFILLSTTSFILGAAFAY